MSNTSELLPLPDGPVIAAASPGEGEAARRLLVVIGLYGGNDGLNTVVPHRQDAYYRARPGLAVPRGELDRALEWMNRVYQLRSAELGPNSVDTNTTRNNLANLLRSLGDDRRASELLEQTSQVMLETVGEDHPDYNAVQINLATTWRDLGRDQEALAILEQTGDLGEGLPRRLDSRCLSHPGEPH